MVIPKKLSLCGTNEGQFVKPCAIFGERLCQEYGVEYDECLS